MVRRANTKEVYERLDKPAQARENTMENVQGGSISPSNGTTSATIDLTTLLESMGSDMSRNAQESSQARPRAIPKTRLATPQASLPPLSNQSPLPPLSTQAPLPSVSTQSPLPTPSAQVPLPPPSAQQVDYDQEMEDASTYVAEETSFATTGQAVPAVAEGANAFPMATALSPASIPVTKGELEVLYKAIENLIDLLYRKTETDLTAERREDDKGLADHLYRKLEGNLNALREAVDGFHGKSKGELNALRQAVDSLTQSLKELVVHVVVNKDSVLEISEAVGAMILPKIAAIFQAEFDKFEGQLQDIITASGTVEGASRKRKRAGSDISEPESPGESQDSPKLIEVVMDLKQEVAELKDQLPVNNISSNDDIKPKINGAMVQVDVNIKYTGKDHLPGTHEYNEGVMFYAEEVSSLRRLDIKVTSQVLDTIKRAFHFAAADKASSEAQRNALPKLYRTMAITAHGFTGDTKAIDTHAAYQQWLEDSKSGGHDLFALDFNVMLTDDEGVAQQWIASNNAPLDKMRPIKGRWFTLQLDAHNNSD